MDSIIVGDVYQDRETRGKGRTVQITAFFESDQTVCIQNTKTKRSTRIKPSTLREKYKRLQQVGSGVGDGCAN